METVEKLQFLQWLDSITGPGWQLFTKRLSANDTYATGAHQAGPFVPKNVAFRLFRSLKQGTSKNPRVAFQATVDSHGAMPLAVNIIWYNSKTRDECRITRWGGAKSPILDADATGSICLFAFKSDSNGDANTCRVWLCRDLSEEIVVEERLFDVEPGDPIFVRSVATIPRNLDLLSGYPADDATRDLFGQSIQEFPTGEEIVRKIVDDNDQLKSLPVDSRLLKRRDAEYEEFKRLETQICMPRIRQGFEDVDTFVSYALTVTNRRKSRTGRSLELQMRQIFLEEGISGFGHQAMTEGKKSPDFLFPSVQAYKDPTFPTSNLRMLACKTTCKDRWRQIIDEAARIRNKHLLTLQEGVSVDQFRQMKDAEIQLVAPKPLHKKFPRQIQSEVQTVEEFVDEVSALAGSRN